jgi:hypothetical protein
MNTKWRIMSTPKNKPNLFKFNKNPKLYLCTKTESKNSQSQWCSIDLGMSVIWLWVYSWLDGRLIKMLLYSMSAIVK